MNHYNMIYSVRRGKDEIPNYQVISEHTHELPIVSDWNTLKRWGILQGRNLDDQFCECTLPPGWGKISMGHSMYSVLIDSRGLTRAGIYCAAALEYKDKVFTSIHNRFIPIMTAHVGGDAFHYEQYGVHDNGFDRMVYKDAPVYSAELDGHLLVAVKNGLVYTLSGDTFVMDASHSATAAVILTRDEFHGKWDDNRHSAALKALAQQDCDQFLSQLPNDESVWNAEYDYPSLEEL